MNIPRIKRDSISYKDRQQSAQICCSQFTTVSKPAPGKWQMHKSANPICAPKLALPFQARGDAGDFYRYVWALKPRSAAPVTVSPIVDYGPVWHPIVTKPLGRFTLQSHCGKSGS